MSKLANFKAECHFEGYWVVEVYDDTNNLCLRVGFAEKPTEEQINAVVQMAEKEREMVDSEVNPIAS